jgi:hypothetical protein
MRNRYLTFGGTNLKTAYGLVYSSFEEQLPEPKVMKIDIPAGLDLDITESVGRIGYHDGKQTLKFLLYGGSQEERLATKSAIVAKLHGRRASYFLSWDSDHRLTGRAKVSVRHLTENADLITVEIDREPWRVKTVRDEVDLNCHPSAAHTLAGSARYHGVDVVMRQAGTTKVGSESAVSRSGPGTYSLATDLFSDTSVTVTAADWWMYMSGTNLVVNPAHWDGVSDGDASIGAVYTITNGDMVFPDEAYQHATLRFYRWEL